MSKKKAVPKATPKATPKADLKFEPSLARLEQIVEQLEGGEMTLDESLGLYEEGVGLAKFCRSKLVEVERRVEQVARDIGGEIVTLPVDGTAPEPDEDDDEVDDVDWDSDDDDEF